MISLAAFSFITHAMKHSPVLIEKRGKKKKIHPVSEDRLPVAEREVQPGGQKLSQKLMISRWEPDYLALTGNTHTHTHTHAQNQGGSVRFDRGRRKYKILHNRIAGVIFVMIAVSLTSNICVLICV